MVASKAFVKRRGFSGHENMCSFVKHHLKQIRRCSALHPKVGSVVKSGFTDVADNASIYPLSALGDVRPRVHHFDLLVKPLSGDLDAADISNSLARGCDKVVLLGLRKLRHVAWQNLRNTANLGAYYVESATGSLNNDGAECLGE